jgi:multidrug efflux system membrane fusion protein
MSETANHTHSTHRILLIAAISIVCLVAFLILRPAAKKTEAPGEAATSRGVPIETSTVRQGDIDVSVQALGTVTPVYTVNVYSRVQGQIMTVNYKEGQTVKKDDSLVEVDPRPYQAALLQAEGQLVHDQGVLRQAEIDLVRYRKAYAKNAIPKQQLDDQEQLVLQTEGTVKADQGTLDNAKVNLVYTHITSPIEGRVGLRLVDPGNIVQANSTTSLVVVTQLQPITVIFSVAEDYLPQIQDQLKKGSVMAVEAYDRAQTHKLAAGKFLTLDNLVDTTTGTVKIRAVFANEDDALFPNQFVNAKLLLETLKGTTLVSTPAIQRNAQGAFVYVIRPNQTAEMRTVKVGVTEGDVSAVQGVKPGEVVAISGFDKLQEGAKVSIRKELAGEARP